MGSVLRYSELLPNQLSAAWQQGSAAVLPFGALEWHGDHLPLGLDLIVAEWFAQELCGRIKGVLLPSCWAAITTLPHPYSLQSPSDAQPAVWRSIINKLIQGGCKKVFVVTGHYAQGHLIELLELCLAVQKAYPSAVCMAATPLQLLDDPNLLDHAGRSEASQLLALRPELVNLKDLDDSLDSQQTAVLGPSPRGSTAQEGLELLTKGLAAWENAALWDSAMAESWMKKELAGLESYRQTWLTSSWEDAINQWWEARSSQA